MTERIPLKDAAYGRWRGILYSLGFPERSLSGKHGPCPICDGGKDRFRFDDQGRGTWICSHCGAGDGISLVMQTRGIDFKSAAALIEPLLGNAPITPVKTVASDDDMRRWRNDAWRAAGPVCAHDPVGLFLQRRTGLVTFPRCLRFHPDLEHRDDDGRCSRHPAMLALVTGPDGRACNLHRTYLTQDGEKAAVGKPRMMMPGTVMEGSAVRLVDIGSVHEMGIAEGIETALASTVLTGMPCWAAVDAGKLSKWRPPAGVKRVVIFSDNDGNFAGQHAAYQLANRLSIKDKLKVDVRVPEAVGADWNDVLMERVTQAAC